MNPKITLGKIVTASNLVEAREVFSKRKENNIGGVIFKTGLDIPQWTELEKVQLTRTLSFFEDTQERDRIFSEQLLSLADQFNICMASRHIYFMKDDLVHEPPHRSAEAVDGWMHINFCGQGILCANPQGEEPVQISLMNRGIEGINLSEFNKLVSHQKIKLIQIQAGEAIVHDETMIQKATQPMQRFSGMMYGKN